MKRILFCFCLLFLLSFTTGSDVVVDKEEAQKAFALLNDIRTNPDKYFDEFPFLRNTKIKNTLLMWNDTLAQVAETKAYDMASKNYYGHVDPKGYGINYYIGKSGYRLEPQWTDKKAANNFESIAAEVPNGEAAIKTFLIDKGNPGYGHRRHLLGMGDWNSSLFDIGIGFARRDKGSQYHTYVSLIIAKHNW